MPVFELLTGSPASEEEWAALLAAVLYLQHSLMPPATPAAADKPALSPWQRSGRLAVVSPYRHPGSAGLWTEG